MKQPNENCTVEKPKSKFGYIETERLILREFSANDCEDIAKYLNNYEVTKYLLVVPFPYTIEDAKAFVTSTSVNSENSLHFAITIKSTGKLIGCVSATLKENKWSGGIWIATEYHGHGYGKEAFNARNNFLFEVLGAKEVYSAYFFDNISSKTMHEKLGFVPTGKRSKQLSLARKQDVDVIETVLKLSTPR